MTPSPFVPVAEDIEGDHKRANHDEQQKHGCSEIEHPHRIAG